MRLKELTPALVGQLEERLRFLENQEYKNVFQHPNFPHIKSPVSGSVATQSSPTWYTHIHDILEHSIVEYSEEDIENHNFLELKLGLSDDSLDIYLFLPKQKKPTIKLSLEADVQNKDAGTFQLKSLNIDEFQINKNTLGPMSVA